MTQGISKNPLNDISAVYLREIAEGRLKQLEKASALAASDNPADQDKAREIRVRHDYESLKKQIGSKKKPTRAAVKEETVDEGVTAKYKGKQYKLLPGKVREKMSGKGGLDGDYRDEVGKAKDWVTDKLKLTNTKRDGVKCPAGHQDCGEDFSDWRTDLELREITSDAKVVDDDSDEEPEITEKKVKNKIKINPTFKENAEELAQNLGGQLLEVAEVVDNDEDEDGEPGDNKKLEMMKKKEKQLKKRMIRMKMMAINQTDGEGIIAHHELEGEMIEGYGKGVKMADLPKGSKVRQSKKVAAPKGSKMKKEEVVIERLGGKGYKPYTSMTGKKVSGDWEDSDRGAGNKAKKRAGGTVKKKSPTYLAHVHNKEEFQLEDRSIFKKAMSKVFKKKQEERKPEKAQDAGARAKRMLARKVHAKYVSGSEDNVPDDIRDSYEATKQGEVLSAFKRDPKVRKRFEKSAKKEGGPGSAKNRAADDMLQTAKDIAKRKGDTSKSDDRYAYEEVQTEAKVDKGRSDYGKASIRNYRSKGPGYGEPAMFDPENKRGKLIDKRREEHKARRGVKGAKVPAYKVSEEVIDERTLSSYIPSDRQGEAHGANLSYVKSQLKKKEDESTKNRGDLKKRDAGKMAKQRLHNKRIMSMGEDKALEFVRANIIKKHGKGAIYDPKKKQSPEDKAKVAAERKKRQDADNKAYASRAKKAGFKSTQDYTDVVARYGSEDNYKKGKGLGT